MTLIDTHAFTDVVLKTIQAALVRRLHRSRRLSHNQEAERGREEKVRGLLSYPNEWKREGAMVTYATLFLNASE